MGRVPSSRFTPTIPRRPVTLWRACPKWKFFQVTVRQHNDDRAIFYGVYDTAFQNEWSLHGGKFVTGSEFIPEAIYEVARNLQFPLRLAEECIFDLPAEEI
jgi:hypothetical protein